MMGVRSSMWVNGLFLVVLLTGIAMIYGSGLRNGYIFDDMRLVDGTIVLTKSYSLSFSFRSLWNASYPWIHQVFGDDIAWQRGFNIVLHATNALMLWFLTRRLLDRALQEQSDRNGRADFDYFGARKGVAIAGLHVAVVLWALNPVAVYAVAYLIQRSTVMATTFVLVSLLAFVEGMRSGRWPWFVVTGIGYLLVLMSKEHGAPAIALLLPLYVWWQRPMRSHLWRITWMLGGVAVLASVLVFVYKGWTFGGATEDMVQPFLRQLREISPVAENNVFAFSVINQMWLFFRYGIVWLMPWVGWLSIDIRVPFPVTWWSAQLLGAFAFLALVAVAIWLTLARRGLVSLLGLLLLIPAILFVTEFAYVRLQEVFVLYRSYLWSIAFPGLLSITLVSMFSSRLWLYGVGVILAIGWGAMSYERVQSMRDERTVWQDAVEKLDTHAADNVLGRWRAPLNLSMALLGRRDNEEAFRVAALSDKLGAPSGLAKFNQAAALANMGRHEQALQLYEQSEREGFTFKGDLYKDQGMSLAKLGRFEEALRKFDASLEFAKTSSLRSTVLLAAGRAANSAGQHGRAISYYRQLEQLQPGLTAVPIGIAFALHKQGDMDGALRVLNESLAKRPTAEVLHARSYVFFKMNNRQRALADIEVALAIDPTNVVYQDFRAQILKGNSEARYSVKDR